MSISHHAYMWAVRDLDMDKTTTQTEIALSIKAALYSPAPYHKPMSEVAVLIMSANMRRGVAGKASPVAAKALARMEANGLV